MTIIAVFVPVAEGERLAGSCILALPRHAVGAVVLGFR